MSQSRLLPLIASVGVLSACNQSPQHFETPAAEYLWPKGETIGFKRKYKDIPALAGCIRKRIPSQYAVVASLAPHGGVWDLTLTQRGSKIVEAHYTGNYMFPGGITEIEWSRTRRPYDDVVILTKAAEDPILGCTTPD
jgi:hypothetical protein